MKRVVFWAAVGVFLSARAPAQRPPGSGKNEGAPVTATTTTDDGGKGQAEAAVVAGNTGFALDLYAALKGRSGNLFFSPYSVSSALAMTAAGAKGETAGQMAATLRLPPDPAPAFGRVIARINGEGEPPGRADTLVSANALWLKAGGGFLPGFLAAVKTDYHAGVNALDFAADPEAARRTINDWVAGQTRDKIRDLIGPSVLGRDTSAVLTNAIYFKGAWQSPFRPERTAKGAVFHAPGGDTTADLMAQTGQFRHHDGGTFQALELPYQGSGRAMIVLLPKTADGLPALEASLNGAGLAKSLGALTPTRVAVELPRFTLTESFELADTLKSLGMTDAFDPSRADFSGATGRKDVVLSAVIHKAFVDVNEAGTEAAAATAVVMTRMSAAVQPEPVTFRADRPFLVLIRDQGTGSLLFLGRVTNPKA